MKKLLFLTYCLWLGLFQAQAGENITIANMLYDEANYEEAAEAYKAALAEHPSSAELWYDLGNAHYKAGHIGHAVAAYRKAHKLDPTDEDIRFNLQFVFNKTADKIEPKPKSFIVRQTDIVANVFTPGAWALGSVLLAALALGAFMVYIFVKNYQAKKAGFIVSVLLWLGAFFFVALAAHRYYYSLDSYVVIVVPGTDILAEPNDNATRLLLLHEGATLELQKSEGNWIKIRLPNGSVGYVKGGAVTVI